MTLSISAWQRDGHQERQQALDETPRSPIPLPCNLAGQTGVRFCQGKQLTPPGLHHRGQPYRGMEQAPEDSEQQVVAGRSGEEVRI